MKRELWTSNLKNCFQPMPLSISFGWKFLEIHFGSSSLMRKLLEYHLWHLVQFRFRAGHGCSSPSCIDALNSWAWLNDLLHRLSSWWARWNCSFLEFGKSKLVLNCQYAVESSYGAPAPVDHTSHRPRQIPQYISAHSGPINCSACFGSDSFWNCSISPSNSSNQSFPFLLY